MSVQFCTQSTITEAWALAVGLPVRFDETEASTLYRAARNQIEGLREKPAILAVEVRDPAPPFWTKQVAWDDERYRARFGHRYLSVHFLPHGGEHYQTYDQSLRAEIERWLRLYEQALTSSKDPHAVDGIGFGYVNKFELPGLDFDLSRYFRMSFGITTGPAQDGLHRFELGYEFLDRHRDVHLTVNLSVDSGTPEADTVRVVTKVFAEKRGLEGISFATRDQLAAANVATKEAAKTTFFELATEETHTLMGAVSDAAT